MCRTLLHLHQSRTIGKKAALEANARHVCFLFNFTTRGRIRQYWGENGQENNLEIFSKIRSTRHYHHKEDLDLIIIN